MIYVFEAMKLSLIVKVMKSRRMRQRGQILLMGDRRNQYRILVGKSERRRLIGRSRC
jgi:hypothetical protein